MIDYAARVRESIAKHGFHTTYVARKDPPSFCYSTGIFKTFAIPEIFVSSLPPNLSHELMTQYVQRHSKSRPPLNQRIARIDERFDYYLIPVRPESLSDYALASLKFYESETFECVQLIYPDVQDKFPHEDGYDYDQEIIGQFPPR